MIFALEKYDDFFENTVVKHHSLMNDIPIRRYETTDRVKKFEAENPDEEYIVIGSIGWIESYLGFQPKPDYYPEFLSEWFGREIWETDKWPLNQRVFIKPSDKYKRFNGLITNGGYRGKKKPPYICSTTVKFEDEWRYYIANGKVIFSAWYQGKNKYVEEPTPAPVLDIDYPSDYCGAVDFGRTDDGRILLVEAQHPYGIGWYGKTSDHKEFIEWSIAGWRYMKGLLL
jgi:hypothetical protein